MAASTPVRPTSSRFPTRTAPAGRPRRCPARPTPTSPSTTRPFPPTTPSSPSRGCLAPSRRTAIPTRRSTCCRSTAASAARPIRLQANDAAACQTTTVSPGLTNDWPKWSPQAVTANGKTYYWLTFSSKRTGTGNAQLYITAVVVDEVGQISTYPALYLWNQPSSDGNHTPSWDDFAIPPITLG